MKKGRKVISIMAAVLMLILSASWTAVYAISDMNSSASVINKLDTNIVKIGISEYSLDDDHEILWQNLYNISPGKKVDKIPRITAEGVSCYIRAKIEISTNSGNQYALTEKNIGGMPESWMKIGDYYYCTDILNQGDQVDLFKTVSIPDEWNNQSIYGGAQFTINVLVDAIQADNFTPQFNTVSPWGNAEILESIQNKSYKISKFETGKESFMDISVQDDGKIIMNPENFFAGFNTFVPGDSVGDKAIIQNNGNADVCLYFSTKTLEDLNLIENMGLKLYLTRAGEKECIYDGSLDSKYFEEEKVIAVFGEKETGELSFTVDMPEELNNDYSLRNGAVKWSLRTRTLMSTPDTGDAFHMVTMIVTAGISLAIVVFAITRKRTE